MLICKQELLGNRTADGNGVPFLEIVFYSFVETCYFQATRYSMLGFLSPSLRIDSDIWHRLGLLMSGNYRPNRKNFLFGILDVQI